MIAMINLPGAWYPRQPHAVRIGGAAEAALQAEALIDPKIPAHTVYIQRLQIRLSETEPQLIALLIKPKRQLASLEAVPDLKQRGPFWWAPVLG